MKFSYAFAELGEEYARPVSIYPLEEPVLASWNPSAARLIDLDEPPENLVALVNGQIKPDRDPVASLYAGHQFGVWVPQLGDGRAAILGQINNRADEPWELQVKGGGPTPFSRGGDGRAALRSSIREYLCSEALDGLGIATTRALALLDSKTPVYRETLETGALLVRMAPTHIRFGTFEVFAARGQTEQLRELADFVITHFYPGCGNADQPYLELYRAVIEKTAQTFAAWMAQGFSHGVLNTDNMSILGLTLDYGPFGFMDAYQPGYICNHSDHHGRYAFNQQPNIAMWNLGCLGNALLPLLDQGDAQEALSEFPESYNNQYYSLMHNKLGISNPQENDRDLVQALLRLMAETQADYCRTFRLLSRTEFRSDLSREFGSSAKFQRWLDQYDERTSDYTDREHLASAHNPKYLLRNYMAQIAIERAEQGDYTEINRLLNIVQSPFEEHPDADEYAGLPPEWAQSLSLSCSS